MRSSAQKRNLQNPPLERAYWIGGIVVALVPIIGFAFWIGSLSTQVGLLREDQNKLEGRLNGFVSDLLNQLSKKTSAKKSVETTLELSRAIIAAGKQQGLKPSPQSLGQIGKDIATLQPSDPIEAGTIWQTVSSIVNYRSEVIAPATLQHLAANVASLPRCFEHEPAQSGREVSKDGRTMTMSGPILYVRCVVDLDGNPPAGSLPMPTIFRDCIVQYHGGEIVVRSQVVFDHSFFIFSVQAPPSQPGLKLSEYLLASDNTLYFRLSDALSD